MGPLARPDDVQIRIENRSETDFGRVSVGFPLQTVEYGVVRAGETSPYAAVEEAYGYAYVEVLAGQRTLVFQPIDYVGATLLEPGRYTYGNSAQVINGPAKEGRLNFGDRLPSPPLRFRP